MDRPGWTGFLIRMAVAAALGASIYYLARFLGAGEHLAAGIGAGIGGFLSTRHRRVPKPSVPHDFTPLRERNEIHHPGCPQICWCTRSLSDRARVPRWWPTGEPTENEWSQIPLNEYPLPQIKQAIWDATACTCKAEGDSERHYLNCAKWRAVLPRVAMPPS